MKFTSSTVALLLLPPMAASFHVNSVVRKSRTALFAIEDDVPDIVKAYAKTGPKDFSKIGPAGFDPSSVASVVDPSPVVQVPSVVDVPIEAPAEKFKYVNEFLNAAQQSVQAPAAPTLPDASSVTDFFSGMFEKSKSLPQSLPRNVPGEAQKVPNLSEFIQNGAFEIKKSGYTELSGVTEEKAKPLAAYFVDLFEKQSGGSSVSDAMGDKVAMLGIPEGTGWVVAAVAIFIAIVQRGEGMESAQAGMEEMVQREAMAVSELADEVKIMMGEIKKLNVQTAELRTELESAKLELSEKNLEMSQERLKASENERKLKKEIEILETKIKESDNKIKEMKGELSHSQDIGDVLSEALEKVENNEVDLEAASAAAAISKKKEATKPRAKRAVKGSTKTAASTRSAAKKGKAKAKAKDIKVDEIENPWGALSNSTLQRKTVKELTQYLEGMGVETTDADGKPLKKALLVEAVQSLDAMQSA